MYDVPIYESGHGMKCYNSDNTLFANAGEPAFDRSFSHYSTDHGDPGPKPTELLENFSK